MVADLPLFRTAHEALSWARNPRAETVRISGAYALKGRGRLAVEKTHEEIEADKQEVVRASTAGLERRPVALEAAAQAGMIKSCVLGLTEWERCHIQAKYFRNGDRMAAQERLTRFVLPTLDMVVRNRRLVYELVARYYGKPVKLPELAARFEMERKLVSRYQRGVQAVLDRIAVRAEEMLTVRLKERGVI
jgi:hypothetical protein